VFETLLEAIKTPALILNGDHEIVKANSAAQWQYGCGPGDSLSRDARGQDLEESWDLVPLALRIKPHLPCWQLATVRDQSADLADKEYVSKACVRWELTRRQSEVLELVVRGMANASIGDVLGLRLRTVEFHVTGIFDKVGVDSRVALIAAVMNITRPRVRLR
jgi:DNA-binding NarL/FixJ family response regulator